MIKKHIFLLNFFLLVGAAKAEVTSETFCFINSNNSNSRVMLQTYLDYSLNKIVGAFVKYRGSRDIIALVYVGGSGASDNSNDRELLSMEGFGEYELLWLEVFKKKITGEYRLVKPKGGTITGAYMIYKNYSTGKDTLFSPSGEVNSRCSDFIMPGPR